jgi:hypothetical protein
VKRRTPKTSAALLLSAILHGGCAASILPLYEQARSEALSDPGGIPSDWEPDLVLHLSKATVDDLITTLLEEKASLDETFEVPGPLGTTARVVPQLSVDALTLGSSKVCAACLSVDANLLGSLDWSVANQSGSVPVQIDVVFDVAVAAEQGADVWSVGMTVGDLRGVEVAILDLQANLEPLLEDGVGDWARQHLLSQMPSLELGKFGDPEVPLRALTLVPSGDGIDVRMLSDSPTPNALSPISSASNAGFLLFVSQGSLLDLARVTAFEAGPVAHDVVVEPTSFAVDGTAFTLGIRLWRIVGRGWWRDYVVQGDLQLVDEGLQLTPRSVVEGDKSEGAEWVDPLAALGEGYILEIIEKSVSTVLPIAKSSAAGDLGMSVSVSSMTGEADALVVRGELALTPSSSRTRPRPPRGRPRGR